MSELYEKATPRPWRFVPWHIEEGVPVCRAPAGHICGTFASDVDASLAAHAVNNIERIEAENARLTDALKTLCHNYVRLMENARDRIIMLGGDCDPLERMERDGPWLNEARAALSQSPAPALGEK